jgi:peroxiredoxin
MIKKQFTQYWTYYSIVILLAGLAWIWFSAAPASGTTNGSIPEPRQGFLAPEFQLKNDRGELVSISDLKGKAIIINFWASWCPPCRAEMHALERVYQDYSKNKLVILAVNATNQDNLENILAFLQENNISFPILFDEDGTVNQLYKVSALPTTFFIDSNGIIQNVVIGGPMSEALLRARVEKLLGE